MFRMRTKHVCNGKPNKWRDEMRSNLFMYTLRPDGNYTNLFVIFAFKSEPKKINEKEPSPCVFDGRYRDRYIVRKASTNWAHEKKIYICIDNDGKRTSEKPIRHKVNARKWHHQHEAKRQQQKLRMANSWMQNRQTWATSSLPLPSS